MEIKLNMIQYVNIHRALLLLYVKQVTHAEELEICYNAEHQEVKEARKEAEYTRNQINEIEQKWKECHI